jgi:limonene-1,2-epoxide hydrolase
MTPTKPDTRHTLTQFRFPYVVLGHTVSRIAAVGVVRVLTNRLDPTSVVPETAARDFYACSDGAA